MAGQLAERWRVHPAADVFPLLEGEEFDALVADIRAHGLREPIWLDGDGRILDGRNRYRACEVAGVEPRFRTYEGDDVVQFVVGLNVHRRHLTESQRAMIAARIATMRQGARTDLAPNGAKSQPEAAELLSVSRRSVQRATEVQAHADPAVVQAVDRGVVAVADAAYLAHENADVQRVALGMVETGKAISLRGAKRQHDLARQREAIASGHTAAPEGTFDVIVVDPPWPYGGSYQPHKWQGRFAKPYPEMSLDELARLELPASDDCVLWLWTTNGFLPEAFRLLEAWGFAYKTMLTWAKPRMGVGFWLRNRTEHCLLAVKGKRTLSPTNQTTLLEAPQREHSRKPDEFYQLVESLCVGRKLDYFSREARPGWEQYGNEPDRFQAG